MEENVQVAAVTNRSAGIRYGAIMGVIGFIYFVILATTGLYANKILSQWANWAITIVFLVLAHNYYKANGDGFMSYGQGLGIAFWVGLISSIISAPLVYLYVKVLDPTYIDNIRANALAEMESSGQNDQQIEVAMKVVNFMTGPEMLFALTIIFGIIGALIVGLIVSIFTQKPRPQAI